MENSTVWQIRISPLLLRRARKRAKKMNLSLAEYTRRLYLLGESMRIGDMSYKSKFMEE